MDGNTIITDPMEIARIAAEAAVEAAVKEVVKSLRALADQYPDGDFRNGILLSSLTARLMLK